MRKFKTLFEQRWPGYVGGLALAFIATIAFFRVALLGVTAELGSMARTIGSHWNLLPERLEGLDSFAGCRAEIRDTLLSPQWVLCFAARFGFRRFGPSALFAGQFRVERPTLPIVLRNFSGGLLMGWGGAMLALG